MKEFKGKAIYNPTGKAGEYAKWACNFYTGCSNQCDYCYCRKGVMSHVWSDKPKLKKCFTNEENAINVFESEMLKNKESLQRDGLFFTFTSDPFIDDVIFTYLEAAEMCVYHGIPVTFLTKRADFLKRIEKTLFYSRRNLVCFGFTLTGHDELEPFASTNLERIDTMEQLNNLGFKTFASIEPIVDFANSMLMIKASSIHCDLFKVGLMSGKKYDVVEAQKFVEDLMKMKYCKFYIKESLTKLTGYTNKDSDNFVSSNYNLFLGREVNE